MKTKTISEHTRELGVTANIEKRVLIWLAERLPQWVTSDQLTLLGLFAMLMAGLSYWAAQWDERALFLVVVALGLNWFGDRDLPDNEPWFYHAIADVIKQTVQRHGIVAGII